MARKAHCPACDNGDGISGIVTLPHNCPYADTREENRQPVANVPRDDEGRPMGVPFKPSVKSDN